jgi:hypothetical protein
MGEPASAPGLEHGAWGWPPTSGTPVGANHEPQPQPDAHAAVERPTEPAASLDATGSLATGPAIGSPD